MIETKHIGFGIGAIALAAMLYGGSKAYDFANSIEVDTDVQTDVGLGGITYMVNVTVKNPTEHSMDIVTPSANIRVKGGRYFAYSKPFAQKITLKPNDSTSFAMVLTSSWEDIVYAAADSLRSALSTGSITVEVDTSTPVSLLGQYVSVTDTEPYSVALPDFVVSMLKTIL